MYLQNSSSGYHVVCLTMPFLDVINGDITLTDWAMFAMLTYLAWRTKILSQTPTAKASDSVYLNTSVDNNTNAGEVSQFLSTLVRRCTAGIPDIPLIETDCGSRYMRRHTILDARQID